MAWQRANDAELISAVRGGDEAAWDELCQRHRESARRFARTLVPAKVADDLVDRASKRALAELRAGDGPDLAFRPYLLASVRSEQRPLLTEAREARAAVRAFWTLPERWQLVLWHVDVEREQSGQVAPLLGVADSAVQGMTGRARAGLRAETLGLFDREADALGRDCEWTREHLPAHLRGATTRRESARVAAHVQRCAPCASVHDELAAIDDDLAGVLGPLVLGTVGNDYLTRRRAGLVARHPGRAALAGVAAAVALVTGVTVGLSGSTDDPVADAPVIGAPGTQAPSRVDGATLAPSSPAASDAAGPQSPPAGLPTGSGDATMTSSPPASSPGGPSDDSTLTGTNTSGPSSSTPPTIPPTTPPTTPPTPPPPPQRADPAVSEARLPKMTGPVVVIVLAINDVADTDGRLRVVAQDPGVRLSVGDGCTAVTAGSSLTCDLDDAGSVEIVADLSAVSGDTAVDAHITPAAGVVETTEYQRNNNSVEVPLQAPAAKD